MITLCPSLDLRDLIHQQRVLHLQGVCELLAKHDTVLACPQLADLSLHFQLSLAGAVLAVDPETHLTVMLSEEEAEVGVTARAAEHLLVWDPILPIERHAMLANYRASGWIFN